MPGEIRGSLRLLDYQTEQDDFDTPQCLECLWKGLQESGSLLVDVARRLDFQEVTVPVPESGSSQVRHQGFTYRVVRLSR